MHVYCFFHPLSHVLPNLLNINKVTMIEGVIRICSPSGGDALVHLHLLTLGVYFQKKKNVYVLRRTTLIPQVKLVWM